jgi:hypothetical protein
MTAAAHGVEKAPLEGLKAGAKLVSDSVMREVSNATGGSFALRGTAGKKKNGAPKLKPETKQVGQSAVIVAGKPKGIWSMLDSGTDKHVVGAGKNVSFASNIATRSTVAVRTNKKGKTSQVKRRKVLKIGDRYVTGPFLAGGSPARHTFKYGVAKVHLQVVSEIAKRSHDAIIASLLKGK